MVLRALSCWYVLYPFVDKSLFWYIYSLLIAIEAGVPALTKGDHLHDVVAFHQHPRDAAIAGHHHHIAILVILLMQMEMGMFLYTCYNTHVFGKFSFFTFSL